MKSITNFTGIMGPSKRLNNVKSFITEKFKKNNDRSQNYSANTPIKKNSERKIDYPIVSSTLLKIYSKIDTIGKYSSSSSSTTGKRNIMKKRSENNYPLSPMQTLSVLHARNVIDAIFQYSETDEIFENFHLVCRDWNRLSKHIRFHPSRTFNLSNIIQDLRFTKKIVKQLHSIKNIELILHNTRMFHQWKFISPLISKNMYNLVSLTLFQNFMKKDIPMISDDFISELIKKSHLTLQNVYFLNAKFPICENSYPELTHLSISIKSLENEASNLESIFKHLNTNLPKLKVLEINDLMRCNTNIKKIFVHFLNQNKEYLNKCIFTENDEILEYLPMQMTCGFELNQLSGRKFISSIEYIQLQTFLTDEEGNLSDWKNYEFYFTSKFINLKGITFADENGKEILEKDFSNLQNILLRDFDNECQMFPAFPKKKENFLQDGDDQKYFTSLDDIGFNLEDIEKLETIWKERIVFLKNLGIHILNHEEFENIKLKKSNWRIEF